LQNLLITNIIYDAGNVNCLIGDNIKSQLDDVLQLFSNCGPRTISGPRVMPLWSF